MNDLEVGADGGRLNLPGLSSISCDIKIKAIAHLRRFSLIEALSDRSVIAIPGVLPIYLSSLRIC